MPQNRINTQQNQSGVFLIRITRNAKVYVGAAKHLYQAFRKARWELRTGRHHAAPLQAFVTALGLDRLHFEVLELCPVDQLPAAKQRHLDQLHACDPAHGFNSLNPAGPAGQKMSPDARNRLSTGKTGKPITPRTAEHQEKLAAAHRGRKRSPETCAAISAATKGKKKHPKAPTAAQQRSSLTILTTPTMSP